MATKMDLGLDDIIALTKKTGGGRRGGFRGRGGRGGGTRGSVGGGGRGFRSGGSPRRGAMRNATGFKPRSGNPDGVWSHDKFQDGGFGGARRSGLRTAGGSGGAGGGAKITVNNLHFGVTDADIIELFGELGSIRYASVHYDRSGRSMGKADVLFDRRSSAQQAIQQYNGVPLDGRAMEITWANAVAAAPVSPTRVMNRVAGGRISRGPPAGARGGFKGARGGARGGRGGGRGRGGRTQTKTPTAEELDAELDAYVSEKQQ